MTVLLDLATLTPEDLSPRSHALARLSLFDWMVVGRAGVDQPLSQIMREAVLSEGGHPQAHLMGGGCAPARAAALVNGTVSHALDYDDTHFAHVGHLSVAILPAALAVAEALARPAAAVAHAFALGAEAAIRVGIALGRAHYVNGFHQTATAGAFGATLAAGIVSGLDRAALAHALGLASTRASGLRNQFGTMGKPYNAGVAAATGVEAATLAARGLTSAPDGLTGAQGFLATHTPAPDLGAALAAPPPQRFLFDDNLYKVHACCHGLHGMIEGLRTAMDGHGPVTVEQVDRVEVRTNRRWLSVCDLKQPRTGLACKFSYAWVAAMVLTGMDTAQERVWTDALVHNPALAALAQTVHVVADPSLSDTQTEVTLSLAGRPPVRAQHDLAKPLAVATLAARLRGKAVALVGEATARQLWADVQAVDQISARALWAALHPSG